MKGVISMRYLVMSDIHGMGGLWEQVKQELEQEETTLIFLGDACDRGPDGYKIMKEMLSMPNVIYLMGNHEDLFVRSCFAIKDAAADEGLTVREYASLFNTVTDMGWAGDYDVQLHVCNGGVPTLEAWIADNAPVDIVSKIAKLPTSLQMGKYDFCHAGCPKEDWGSDRAMLWDRDHFEEEWYKDRILIHGHTPVKYVYDYIVEEKPKVWKPLHYSNNKIDMDTCAFKTNTICLLDLETNEVIAFTPGQELPTF